MNKRQKEVQQAHLDEEQKIIRQLKQVYRQAAKDCEAKIAELNSRTDMQNLQSIIYQKQYQQALKKQLDGILDTLQNDEFDSIAKYLTQSYENGFYGTLYDLHGQGIPVIFPIDQTQVVKAVQTDTKLSEGMYSRLGEDTAYLKKSIRAELSRGISNGSSWLEIASHIANGMNSPFKKAINNAIRIARTEGHRIQNQAQMDTITTAKEKGADVVKQWDSTLDDRTRDSHKILDGQIREIEDYFEVNGNRALHPGAFGVASEDIHCRCCMLQRAKWALDQDELDTLKERAAFYGLDKTDSFDDFREKYLHLPDDADTMNLNPERVKNEISDELEKNGVAYNQAMPHKTPVTQDQIIDSLAGGDRTQGSCASVGLAYAAQQCGLDVLDFRDGKSRDYFATYMNLRKLSELPGLKTTYNDGHYYATIGNQLLKQVEKGKEYYFVCGCHASIVRRTDENKLQYLELQSANRSGWTDFNGNARYTLTRRFGCPSSRYFHAEGFMIEVDSFKDCKEFQDIVGYINTAENEQRKGLNGTIK